MNTIKSIDLETVFDRLLKRLEISELNDSVIKKASFKKFMTQFYRSLLIRIDRFCHFEDKLSLTHREIYKLQSILQSFMQLMINFGKNIVLSPDGKMGRISFNVYNKIETEFKTVYNRSMKHHMNFLSDLGIDFIIEDGYYTITTSDMDLLNDWCSLGVEQAYRQINSEAIPSLLDDAARGFIRLTPNQTREKILSEMEEIDRHYMNEFNQHLIDQGWLLLDIECLGPDSYRFKYEPMINTVHVLIDVIFGKLYINLPFKAGQMKRLFDGASEETKQFLLDYIKPYTMCSADFCNGMISWHLEYKGQSVRICHSDEYCPNLIQARIDNLDYLRIVITIMDNLYSGMEKSNNRIRYNIDYHEKKSLIGYVHTATPLSISTNRFIDDMVKKQEDGKSKMDALCDYCGIENTGRYYGVILDYQNGQNYIYVLAVECNKPQISDYALAQGLVFLELRQGTYATVSDQKKNIISMWEYFQYDVKAKTDLQMDMSQFPCEIITDNGIEGIQIPVCESRSDVRKDVGYSIEFMPDMTLAGYISHMEEGHPLRVDLVEAEKKLREQYPEEKTIVHGKTHACLGKTYQSFVGIPIDDKDPIPNGLKRIFIKGGYWGITRHRYPNGYHADVYVPDDYFLRHSYTLGHPRPYLCFDYIDRHGSAITAIPLKHHTDYKFELYNREETIVWGRKDELHSPVNDEDLQTYASHRENEKPGIFVCVFYNIKRLFNPFVENTSFFKGFITTQKCEPNCNLQQMVIPAGEYAKIYQNYPNGEMDWAMPHYIVSQFKRESKRLIDNTRPCIVEQRIDKNGFEFHIPIINK